MCWSRANLVRQFATSLPQGSHVKISNSMLYSLMIGSLILQGCATTSSTQPDQSDTFAPAPAPAAAPAPAPAQAAQPAGASAAIPEENGKPVIRADSKDNFEAVSMAVRQQMRPGGRFAYVNKSGRDTVEARLADMQNLFVQYGSVEKMNGDIQARMMDDQNAINEVLARYDNNRLICRQETPVGTHFPKKVCRTYGQMQQERNDAQHLMRIRQNMGQTGASKW